MEISLSVNISYKSVTFTGFQSASCAISFYFSLYLFLSGGQLLYNLVLISAIQQCDSDISIYMSLPLESPSHPKSIPAL